MSPVYTGSAMCCLLILASCELLSRVIVGLPHYVFFSMSVLYALKQIPKTKRMIRNEYNEHVLRTIVLPIKTI